MHTINFQLDKNLFTIFWSHNPIEQITHLNATHTNASNGNYRERARARARSRLSKVTMWTRKIRIDETEGIVCIHTHTQDTPAIGKIVNSSLKPEMRKRKITQFRVFERALQRSIGIFNVITRTTIDDGGATVGVFVWMYLQLSTLTRHLYYSAIEQIINASNNKYDFREWKLFLLFFFIFRVPFVNTQQWWEMWKKILNIKRNTKNEKFNNRKKKY